LSHKPKEIPRGSRRNITDNLSDSDMNCSWPYSRVWLSE